MSIASEEGMSKALDERGTKSGDEGIGFREVIGHTYNIVGEDNHKERGIIGFAGAKYALDAEGSVARGEAPNSGSWWWQGRLLWAGSSCTGRRSVHRERGGHE